MIKVLIALKEKANQNNRKGVSTDGRTGGPSSSLYRLIQRLWKKDWPPLKNCSKCFWNGKSFHKVVAIWAWYNQVFYCNRLQTGMTINYSFFNFRRILAFELGGEGVLKPLHGPSCHSSLQRQQNEAKHFRMVHIPMNKCYSKFNRILNFTFIVGMFCSGIYTDWTVDHLLV